MKISYKERLKIITNEKTLERYFRAFHIPCAKSCIQFINTFCFTYDPRLKKKKIIPFELYPKQEEYITWLWNRLKNGEDGCVDKCRDVGATWLTMAFLVWCMLFQKGFSAGIYTYNGTELDKVGDISTLFGKLRFIVNRLPKMFTENVRSSHRYICSDKTGSDISGSAGDNPGRGGRRTMFIKDESAFYQRPEMIEAALSETSDCKIDVSTHSGTNTVFYQKITSGVIPVFVFNWWDVPKRDQDWYNKKREKAEAEGMLHIFRREIDRDPAASIDSVAIPSDWVNSSCNVDIPKIEGRKILGFDVADEGVDMHALIGFDGNTLCYIDEWHDSDVIEASDRAFWVAVDNGFDELRYDCIGVGAGAKARFNEIMNGLDDMDIEEERKEIARKMVIIGWNAGGAVMRPEETEYSDIENKKLFENAKAQAYWMIRDCFLNAYRKSVGKEFQDDCLIDITAMKDHRLYEKLKRELSQPVHKLSKNGKLMIDKKPKGTKSPNLSDSFVMARCEVEPSWIPWSVV